MSDGNSLGSGDSYVLPDEFFDMEPDSIELDTDWKEDDASGSSSDGMGQDEIMGVSAKSRATSDDNYDPDSEERGIKALLGKLRPGKKKKKEKGKKKKGRRKKARGGTSELQAPSGNAESEEVEEAEAEEEPKGKKKKKAKKEPKKKAPKKKPPKKKPPKKKKPAKKKKKADDEEGGGGGKKKILILILVIALAAGVYFVKFRGGGDEGGGDGSKDEATGVVSVDTSEQDEEYEILDTIFDDGVEVSAESYDPDWYKINFTYRYGHVNDKGGIDVLDLAGYIKALEAGDSEESAQEDPESGEDEKAEDTEEKDDKKDKKDKKKDKDKDKDEEDADSEESEEAEAEPEPTELDIMYEKIQLAEAAAKKWSVATGSVNSYRSMGNEGYSQLLPEFSHKYVSEQAFRTQRDAIMCAMLFANQSDFEITKTLLSNDYNYSYIEFTRNLNVSRCLNDSLFEGSVLEGISEGAENIQRFQLELAFDSESGNYLIKRIRLLETKEAPKVTMISSDEDENGDE